MKYKSDSYTAQLEKEDKNSCFKVPLSRDNNTHLK